MPSLESIGQSNKLKFTNRAIFTDVPDFLAVRLRFKKDKEYYSYIKLFKYCKARLIIKLY